MNEIVAGAIAGLAATAPMTAAMEALHEKLPPEEQYPLPPREITEEVIARVGADEALDEPERQGLTLAAHFGYGTAVGALLGPLVSRSPLPPVVTGVAYGLGVWAGSYLGLLPALGILEPATEHPPRRTALMIAAHVVWGAAAGTLAGRLAGHNGR